MRKPLIAGNWKMHLTIGEATTLVQALKAACQAEAVDVVVCPPFTALASVAQALRGSRIGLGAQNMHWEAKGAFTGEISPSMLSDAGCRYVIIGHSERRAMYRESDLDINRKLKAAIANGLTPILCVGETLMEREADQTWEVLLRQLGGAFERMELEDCPKVVVAYEPVWAIGTGNNATPEQAQESHLFIRRWISTRATNEIGQSVRLLYGGSVNAANAAALLQQPDVDGALVGGASLNADAFSAIVKAAREPKGAVR